MVDQGGSGAFEYSGGGNEFAQFIAQEYADMADAASNGKTGAIAKGSGSGSGGAITSYMMSVSDQVGSMGASVTPYHADICTSRLML